MAIPAFIPATVCTGYLAAWITDLHGFRQRSLVERIFWSVPLSVAISTIASVLIGKFFSLTAVVVFLWASAALSLAIIGREGLKLRRAGRKWTVGWRPFGGTALIVAIAWAAIAVLSLVDLQSGHQLFMSVTIFDHGARVNWTESALRTGVPPANPFYFYKHTAPMRYYYFWNVLCASVAKMAHLPVRGVFIASCVWSGFALAALTGLYLKYFLEVGARLRRQFLISMALLAVTGLDICVIAWKVFLMHQVPPADLEWWSYGQIASWLDSLLWVPHHIASLVCCMFAFLLAWMAGKQGGRPRVASLVLISAALASAFGLSIYVAFGFFLVALTWAFWQMVFERTPRSSLLLGAGGAGATLLLLPYLWELEHGPAAVSSGALGNAGGVFMLSVRKMFPADGVLAWPFFQHLAAGHPLTAQTLANLILLTPGYVFELGFFLVVFLIYLVPAWRGKAALSVPQRSLVFIAAASMGMISILQSRVLATNDFGWRAALLLKFPLLLMASEVMTGWRAASRGSGLAADGPGLAYNIPHWLRSIVALALIVGVIGTVCQAALLRTAVPLFEASMRAAHSPKSGKIPHNAYISSIGYAQLDKAIPLDAVVQFNPVLKNAYWTAPDFLGVNRQTAIADDTEPCGSDLGGDGSGCPIMAATIDALFNGASADQARATCSQFGIQYLVARIYDPVWNDRSSWVWTLKPVVADEEFRAVDCR